MTSAADPKASAAGVRERLELGPRDPLKDSLDAIETQLGVPVSVLDLGPDLAGAYVTRRGKPFILVNGADWKYRRRFTIAHELGHHVLGHAAVVDPKSVVGANYADDPREREANLFAGELLAPKTALLSLLEDMDNPPFTVNVTVHVADHFGISPPAAFVRLSQEGIISDPAARQRIKDALGRNDHYGAARQLGIHTPFEDSLTRLTEEDLPRLPARLEENALTAYRSGLIDLPRLAEILDRPEDTVETQLERLGIVVEADAGADW